jgi:hypothetical protein
MLNRQDARDAKINHKILLASWRFNVVAVPVSAIRWLTRVKVEPGRRWKATDAASGPSLCTEKSGS